MSGNGSEENFRDLAPGEAVVCRRGIYGVPTRAIVTKHSGNGRAIERCVR
jgi:hypothetical protein